MQHRPLPSTVARTLDLFDAAPRPHTHHGSRQQYGKGAVAVREQKPNSRMKSMMIERELEILNGARRTEGKGIDLRQVGAARLVAVAEQEMVCAACASPPPRVRTCA